MCYIQTVGPWEPVTTYDYQFQTLVDPLHLSLYIIHTLEIEVVCVKKNTKNYFINKPKRFIIIIITTMPASSDKVTRQVIKNVLAKLQKEGEGALIRNGITELVFFSFSTNPFHDNPMSSSSTFIYIFLSCGGCIQD